MKNIFIKNNQKYNELKKKVIWKLNKYNVCVLKNFIDIEQISKIFNILKTRNKTKKDIRLSGKFFYKMSDFKRLDIGDSYKNARFARFILFSEWQKKNEVFFNILKPIIDFRNQISGIKKKNYIYENLEKKNNSKYHFCDLVRMIQYPIGGGFLNPHNDYDPFYPKKMINVLLPITNKTTKSERLNTYKSGGLYYIIKKKEILIDNFIEPGDIIFHNQKINHGVKSIDPYKNLNLNTLNGRVTINFSIGKFYIK